MVLRDVKPVTRQKYLPCGWIPPGSCQGSEEPGGFGQHSSLSASVLWLTKRPVPQVTHVLCAQKNVANALLFSGWTRPCPTTLGKGQRWPSKKPCTRRSRSLSRSAPSATRTWSSRRRRAAGQCRPAPPAARPAVPGPIVSFLGRYLKAACCGQPPFWLELHWQPPGTWSWRREVLRGSEERGDG